MPIPRIRVSPWRVEFNRHSGAAAPRVTWASPSRPVQRWRQATQAFIVLRAYSRNHNYPLTQLAADVISGTADMLAGGLAREPARR
jgi:hypothetical protein